MDCNSEVGFTKVWGIFFLSAETINLIIDTKDVITLGCFAGLPGGPRTPDVLQ
jgi:hypothetical protein